VITSSAVAVFEIALRLGASSFGGPVAHLGYFERTYVRRV
jgi:chromate transporter